MSYFVILSIVVGICLGFGLIYLFIGLRRKDNKRLNLLFTIFALSYAGTVFNGIRFHSTTSLAEFLFLTRWDAVFVVAAFTSLLWYVADYTRVKPRIFLGGLTAAFIIPGLINIIRPNLLYEKIVGLTYITLPWGEQLTEIEATDTVWMDVFLLAQLTLLGYILFACFRQYRRGERQAAILLAVGMSWFILTIIYEILGETGVVAYFPLGELGFLGLAIVMSLQMSNSVIRTEEELARHRQELEILVDERTAELSQEIEERTQTEAALRESEEKFRNLAEQSPNMIFINQKDKVVYANQKCSEILGYSRETFYAPDFDFLTLIAPEHKDLIKENFRRHMAGEDVPAYKYALITKAGQRIEVIGSPALINYQGELAILGVVTDITEHVRTEQALNRRVGELATLNQIAQTVTMVTDLPVALERVSEIVAHLFQARSIRITLPANGTTKLKVIAGFVREPVPPETTPQSFPLPQDLDRRVLRQGESLILSDMQSRELPPQVRQVVTDLNLHGILFVPLVVHGSTIGFMSVATDQPDRVFTSDEVSLAETIASDIAAAVENARLLEQEKAAAEERSRIARELHDSVTQTMYSISIVAEALPRLLGRDLTAAKHSAAYLRQTTLGALAEMRTLLFELRPDTLVKASLNVLLQQLADVLTGRTRVPVDVTITGDVKLPVKVKITLYRIAQEAFNNIDKHAGATQVWATLRRKPEQVSLTIRDNGQGFDPESIPEERLGLQIMRERAEEIGANLQVESEIGQGSQVSVTWSDPAD